MADLPELAVQKIVERLAGGSVFQLVKLASVSRAWRGIVRRTPVETLRLESATDLHSCGALKRDAFAAKFHRAAPASKTTFYLSAARLIQIHASVVCLGPAVTDSVLAEVANASTESLTVQDCPSVTDSSLALVVLLCPNLQHLHLKDLPGVRGYFLPTLLRKAHQLRSLTLAGLPALDWSCLALRSPRAHTLPALRSFAVESARLEDADQGVFSRFPGLQSVSLGCEPPAVWAATQCCPELEEVILIASSSPGTDDCLAALLSAPALRTLELCPRSFTLTAGQLRLAGMLNLRELRLTSHAFKIQPLSRAGHVHLDNEGIKALVDSICTRCLFQRGKQPFRLSLCGASGITHNAVSALLRLPLLSGLLIDGCHRISSIDRMRLVAKVKAGRELLEGGTRRRQRQERRSMLISCAA